MRTAIIVSCSKEEADQVRQQAGRERRSMSGYVLNVMARWLAVEERVRLERRHAWEHGKYRLDAGPRTTFLVRCSSIEATRIKTAAAHRHWPVSGMILHVLWQSWIVSRVVSGDKRRSATKAPEAPRIRT